MRMLIPTASDWAWSRRGLFPAYSADIFEEFDRIAGGVLRSANVSTEGLKPNCDVRETKDHYLVSFDMPGVKREDIKIEVHDNQLVISGERRFESQEKDGESTLRNERVYGKFERTFGLPNTIQIEKIEAHYEDGVLNVALPKAEAVKPRTIQIQSGTDGFFSKLLGAKKESAKEVKDVRVS